MIRVMLVDDEPFIRKGLRQLVNWGEYGFEVVAEAENGARAIEILQELSVDLMFVDIKMPGMTGLELIEYVRENISADIQIVVLTGYADFDYAQRAIQLAARDYVLKPVKEEELIAVLKKRNEEYFRVKQAKKENFAFHLSRLILGKYSQEDLSAVTQKLPADEEWRYVSLEPDNQDENFGKLDYAHKMETQQLLAEYLQRILGEDGVRVVESPETDDAVFGVGVLLDHRLYEEREVPELAYIENLQKRASVHLGCRVLAYAGQQFSGVANISKSYQSVRVTRCFHNLAEQKSDILTYEDYRTRQPSMEIREEEIEQLMDAVRAYRKEDILRISYDIFSRLREGEMTMEMINASLYHILYRLMGIAREFNDETNQREVFSYISGESFDQLILKGSEEAFGEFVLDYAGYLEQVKKEDSKDVLEKIVDYIGEHFQENLSLKSLGERFYINNVYLGQVFKKRYGVAFKDYLNRMRMEKAKELLENTNHRVYEIAGEVGFGNVDYFINKFVQSEGVTPNHYRMRGQKKSV